MSLKCSVTGQLHQYMPQPAGPVGEDIDMVCEDCGEVEPNPLEDLADLVRSHVSVHHQVPMSLQGNQFVCDAGIVELIELIWGIGCTTTASCEDCGEGVGKEPDGKVWVEIPQETIGLFLSAVAGNASNEIESLYNRIYHLRYPMGAAAQSFTEDRAWKYRANPYPTPNGVVWTIGVRFPATDLVKVCDRLRHHPAITPNHANPVWP